MKYNILRECLRKARSKNSKDLHPEYCNFPHFSFIVWNNKILKWGTNTPGDTPSYLGYSKISKTHAELCVVRKCFNLDLSGSIVVNIRLNRYGETKLSAPCKSCKALLTRYGIKQVYYSVDGDKFECVKLQIN